VQFWTYTCVNWLRTLPYVREWAAKYQDQGLSVIGVHTPEFGFERDADNVIAAARDMRVDYPIALDSNYAVWRAFANHFWPALYIADEQGRIRYHHFGEGEYAMSEMVVQQLLREAGKEGFDPAFVSVDPQGTEVPADWSDVRTPETYLAYGRAYGFASPDGERFDEPYDYPEPSRLSLNQWAPSGVWTLAEHAAVLNEAPGRIAIRFHARDLHLVLAPAGGSPVRFRVLLDGQWSGDAHGVDIDEQGNGVVTEPRLYQLIRQRQPIIDRQFEIEFLHPGVEAFVFTFG
jgi:thiol-disulfide isomerase/thioredoxin